MNPRPLQKRWAEIAEQHALEVRIPHRVAVSRTVVEVPVLLVSFGARCGMLLVTEDCDLTLEHADELVRAGYGYSCQLDFEERGIDDESLFDRLREWGWCGPGEPPAGFERIARSERAVRGMGPLERRRSGGHDVRARCAARELRPR